jgi:2-alkyl-3-oxoalkanoate reductase
MLGAALRERKMPIIGSGDALWAMIHTDDAAGAYVAAAEKPASGIWHIVDDELVSARAFLNEFAAGLGAPAPRRFPVWLAKKFAGEQAVAYFTKSTRTTNARFRQNFGWTPQYPTYRDGLQQIIAEWKKQYSKTAGM